MTPLAVHLVEADVPPNGGRMIGPDDRTVIGDRDGSAIGLDRIGTVTP